MVKNPPARQETWIWSLVQEDATCLQAPKPVHHRCRTRGPRPVLCNKRNMEVKSLSHVRLFPTPWTVAYHAPPSMGFSRQEHWVGSGIGWVATQPNWVGCHCLLQRIFLTQRSNPVSLIVGNRFTVWARNGKPEHHNKALAQCANEDPTQP